MRKLYYIVLDPEKQNKEKGIAVLVMSGQRLGWVRENAFIASEKAVKKLNEYNINYRRERIVYKE